uniref:Putative secreted protein n=1 Tax=Ixodes ricinus TaxID=34613 RepID=A0A6B0UH31_IXORI
MSCLAMSLHLWTASLGTRASFSQSRCTECVYTAAGVACVTRVVVTRPVDFPLSCALLMKESISWPASESHSERLAMADTPSMVNLVLAPQNSAVAEAALSVTCLSTA